MCQPGGGRQRPGASLTGLWACCRRYGDSSLASLLVNLWAPSCCEARGEGCVGYRVSPVCSRLPSAWDVPTPGTAALGSSRSCLRHLAICLDN